MSATHIFDFFRFSCCLEEIAHSTPADWNSETRSDAQSFFLTILRFSFVVAFSKHQMSACHKEANEAINLLPNQLLGNVDDLMSQEIHENKVNNKKMFIKILQNIRFLAHQGLPLRSHGEAESNFLQLFCLRGLDCPLVKP